MKKIFLAVLAIAMLFAMVGMSVGGKQAYRNVGTGA